MTKGYNFSVEDINKSCPADLEPYGKAYVLKQKESDEKMWTLGMYFQSAFSTTLEHAFSKNAKSEYVKEPFTKTLERNRTGLTEEEKMRELEKFEAEQRAMRANWRRKHGNVST